MPVNTILTGMLLKRHIFIYDKIHAYKHNNEVKRMIPDRLKKARVLMERYGIDAYIITDSDPHSSEYSAGHWKTRSWLSGFTGSNGTLVVTRDEAALWTDGRYYIQAESQLSGSEIVMMRGGEPETPEYPEWIAGKATCPSTVGVDGRTFSCAEYNRLAKAFEGMSISINTEYDIVGELWTDGRPEVPKTPVFCHDLRYSGKRASEKLSEVRAENNRRGASYTIIAGLEDAAWLLNIRGADIANLPVAYAFVFVSPDDACLYIDMSKVPDDVRINLREQGVSVADADSLAIRLESLKPGDRICCDARKLNKWLRNRIPDGVKVIYSDEPTILLKAVKNEAEIQGHKECQAWDGAAMVRFMMWLERRVEAGGGLDEWDAVLELSRLRKLCPECRGDSFNTIAGYGPNGAMMHYAPNEGKKSEIKNEGLMVLDSGGQYPGGTTDITRTIVFKKTTPEERRDYTLTLKAHIALASARFLYGATGGHIDVIARKVMWDNGMDYKCGTGHGVGCYLSVHEGPQSISMRTGSGTRLEENMIVSVEPGVYREGKHGVRIENLVRIVGDYTNEFGRFMRFEPLTYCPISLGGVEAEMLDASERKWLNDYHRAVYEKISLLLGGDERKWLAHATKEI
jgi:Xaa-Pro aminopeptidase